MMEKKYIYFQPEYVGKFKCDGAKCNARCCKNWLIFIDKESYQKYPSEIAEHIKFFPRNGEYLMMLNDKNFCPMLTENNLCRIQLEHGEDFLSKTCASYPRYTRNFGKFFERSLTLTCPVAAEMILFQNEPMTFEFVEVSEKIHSNGGKIASTPVQVEEYFAELMPEIQIAMISILQERTLTIDQRLIMLGFFLDRFEEMHYGKTVTIPELIILIGNLRKLIAAYESKIFLREQVPLMLRIVSFSSEKFVRLILNLLENFYGGSEAKLTETGREFMNTVVDTLQLKPDKNNNVSISEIVANYDKLAEARKIFLEKYSPFLENYLVNELFMNCYPWRYEESPTKNFALLVASYKIFELIIFSATQSGKYVGKDLLKIVDWFAAQSDHGKDFYKKILEHFKNAEDVLPIMESLLEK